MTNEQWLNTLSTEEKAKMIGNACKMCIGGDDDKICFKHTCAEGITEWLNQERNPMPSFAIADVIETVNNVLAHETVTTIWRYNQMEKIFEKIWRANNG